MSQVFIFLKAYWIKTVYNALYPNSCWSTARVYLKHTRKGNRWGKAVAKSFFHTIKTQLILRYSFQNMAEDQQTLFNYIEAYHNR